MSVYRTEFQQVARLALSMWNRDPSSESFGSFDRQWWGWKFKDFGDATLQYAVRLVIPYVEGIGQTAVLRDLLAGYVTHCETIQLSDGSFDQCYPNERTPGVAYDILSTFIAVRQSGYLDDSAARRLDAVMQRAVAFTLRTDEKHGEVANHIAQFAYELLAYAQFSGDERARRRGEAYLDRLLRLFNRDEGWFHEYHGPDAGYQTRALRYLVKCAELRGDSALWEIAERAASFVDDLLMPDGTVHPMLGVRSTALVYPSAFEALARRDTRFVSLAEKIRFGWHHRRVPVPTALDFQNGIRLADDARDAADIAGDFLAPTNPPAAPPSSGWHVLRNAGLVIRRDSSQAVYIGARLGGSVVVYNHGELAYEDAGYILRGRRLWISRAPDAGEIVSITDEAVVVRTRFHRSLHDEVTPIRMFVLRFLNMTVLRSQVIGDLFRKVVVKRLMGKAETTDLVLEREVRVDRSTHSVSVSDRLSSLRGVRGQLYRCRRITGMHMASSRYFQPNELKELPVGWLEPVHWADGAATSVKIVREETPAAAPTISESP